MSTTSQTSILITSSVTGRGAIALGTFIGELGRSPTACLLAPAMPTFVIPEDGADVNAGRLLVLGHEGTALELPQQRRLADAALTPDQQFHCFAQGQAGKHATDSVARSPQSHGPRLPAARTIVVDAAAQLGLHVGGQLVHASRRTLGRATGARASGSCGESFVRSPTVSSSGGRTSPGAAAGSPPAVPGLPLPKSLNIMSCYGPRPLVLTMVHCPGESRILHLESWSSWWSSQ